MRTTLGAILISVTGLIPETFWGDPHQASLKTRYCGPLYSSLLRKQTWVGHRDHFSIYMRDCEYRARTQLVFTHTLVPTL